MLFFENSREKFFLALLLILPFLPCFLLATQLSYVAYNNSSDTFLYLNIAKNIAIGNGFVTSFNAYQYWPEVFHPALPFVHIGLPILLSLFIPVAGSVVFFIYFNFFWAFVNSFLIFTIVKYLYNNRMLGYWAALLVASCVSMQNTTLRVLTEQLSLFVTLVAILLFARSGKNLSPRRLAAIGILLAFGVMIRSSSILYFLAFFLTILFSRDEDINNRFKQAASVFAWSLVLLILFEVAIYIRFHKFFPEYPSAFKDYYLATYVVGGQFFSQVPVIRPFLKMPYANYLSVNFLDMSRVIFSMIRVLLFFSVFRFFNIFKSRSRVELLLFFMAVIQIFTTPLFYPYMRINEFEWVRFLLLPVISLAILGLKELYDFCNRFFPRTKAFLFHSILVIIFLSNFYQCFKVFEIYRQEENFGKVKDLEAVGEWVGQNTKDIDLIAATETIYGGVYLDRPLVALPYRNTLTLKNLEDFLNIYKPVVIIFDSNMQLGEVLTHFGYKKAIIRPKTPAFEIVIRNSSKHAITH